MSSEATRRLGDLSPEKRALLAMRLRANPDTLRMLEADPIAIIGVGCRFPGGVDSPESYWELLKNGRQGITPVPADRWDTDAWYDANPDVPGKLTTRWGGFVGRVDGFDANFFAISPREAMRMDPQHRLLLEVAWEALEGAGQTVERLEGSQTGVFMGICLSDYTGMQLADTRQLDAYIGAGLVHCMAANRLSYAFDLRGPSIALDTACSSSLVSVHMACQSLRLGTCNLALAGGVNLILAPDFTVSFSKARMLSPDGRCKTFDARADGYVRSEGCGVVVLKRLSDALKDKDDILALVLGTAVNQDGHTNGITAPSGLAQQSVIRRALEASGISPTQVGYVEAHGSGTSLGDPIEMEALVNVLGEPRPHGQVCHVGSVKTNLGHTESAAGMAGLIKAALALKHETIPPHLHFERLNPHISLGEAPLAIPTTPKPWPSGAERRFAGVSAFSFGGTNAHVVLEEAPRLAPPQAPREPPERTWLLPLSARSPEALRAMAGTWRDFLGQTPAAWTLGEVAHTASVRRTHHDFRLAVVGRSREELAGKLAAFAQEQAQADVASGRRQPRQGVVFVFCGQGPQWIGMGLELMETEPVFRALVERCDALLRPYTGWSLLEELRAQGSASRLGQTEVTQPALFAVQVALAALWREWGIVPDAVLGHSVGELAAAHVAGALSLEDALLAVYHRARLTQRAMGHGKMLAVGLSEDEVTPLLADWRGRVSVAVINAPRALVLSGEPEAVDAVEKQLQAQGAFCRPLGVDYASHCEQMEPLRVELVEALRGLRPQPAQLPLFSTVTGRESQGEHLGAEYWGRNVREPVRFADAVRTCLDAGHRMFLEVGPHPTLSVSLSECLRERGESGTVLASLRRGQPERASMLGSLGSLYTLGLPVEWSRLYAQPGRLARLPSYPWQRERFWFSPSPQKEARPARREASGLAPQPLLGQRLRSPRLKDIVFESRLSLESHPFVGDHRLFGSPVMPGAGYVCMALAAAAESLGGEARTLEGLSFIEPLHLPEGETCDLQVVLIPEASGGAALQVYSLASGEKGAPEEWTTHATGQVLATSTPPPAYNDAGTPSALRARCTQEQSGEAFYALHESLGIQMAPPSRWVERIWRREGEALARLRQPAGARQSETELLAPALLDACFQTVGATFVERAYTTTVPLGIERFHFHRRPGAELWCHVTRRPGAGREAFSCDVRVMDADGQLVAEVVELQCRHVSRDMLLPKGRERADDWQYEVKWKEGAALEAPRTATGTWVVLEDEHGVGEALARQLRQLGARALRVRPGTSFSREEEDRVTVDPQDPEHLRQLLRELPESCQGVLHLGALDTPAPADLTAATLSEAQRRTCGGVLPLVRALAERGLPHARLWLVTQGAQRASDADSAVSFSQASLWGLGRVISREHPELWGGLVDLDTAQPAQEQASPLLREVLGATPHEDQLALRGGRALVARLSRATPAAPGTSLPVRADAAYLITGGLGGLGLEMARWLVERGARSLVLVGRREPGAPAREVLASLERAGARVHVAQADIGDEAQVARLLSSLPPELGPLRGIIHSAGVVADGVLLQQDWEGFARVLAPKVDGAWHLHHQTRELPLDFFVLFSSMAALLGSAGQGNHAAANAFLDALAHHRRARGLPALSINWGAWAEVGEAARADLDERLGRQGIGAIAPAQGVERFERLMREAPTQRAVVAIDWARWGRYHRGENEPAFLSGLIREATPAQAAPAAPSEGTDTLTRDTLSTATPEERTSLVRDWLRRSVARVLRLSAASRVDVERPLNQMGLDSLMAVELRARIQNGLQVSIPIVDILQGPTVAQLTGLVLEQFAAQGLFTPDNEEWESVTL
ncbi:type I polyketide synthase [Melittangium boletus]|uniref:Polyketide synthase n=1 Tax=Melittangium boletus DSM 14713 TaxID=1294270 RepID=A0A250IMP1_9BACT|nr:type I polyketide synthase [Melittangium boletus]ATB32461.1 polyketide synthase [Melittangium boletus DSM 14713]